MISADYETLSQTAPPSRHDAGRALSTRERWRILYDQIAEGHDPCFRSDQRHQCGEPGCHWRADCHAMRAQWCR